MTTKAEFDEMISGIELRGELGKKILSDLYQHYLDNKPFYIDCPNGDTLLEDVYDDLEAKGLVNSHTTSKLVTYLTLTEDGLATAMANNL